MSAAPGSSHATEVASGDRFSFGENWSRFLAKLSEERIVSAERSLREMLQVDDLRGINFLDIGSGSGLFSLAARRLGAKVHSFDFDPHSVACTQELRRRYFEGDADWFVQEASVLDADFISRLGSFDVVYSWGVLHHTGKMWAALENAGRLVAPSGKLFIAIYNDQGSRSRRWVRIKKRYNALPKWSQPIYAFLVMLPSEMKSLAAHVASRGIPGLAAYVRMWGRVGPIRGMDHWRDIVDWVGGYPFEVATPDAIFDFYRARGFELTRLKCGNVGDGCGEFVFRRVT